MEGNIVILSLNREKVNGVNKGGKLSEDREKAYDLTIKKNT